MSNRSLDQNNTEGVNFQPKKLRRTSLSCLLQLTPPDGGGGDDDGHGNDDYDDDDDEDNNNVLNELKRNRIVRNLKKLG